MPPPSLRVLVLTAFGPAVAADGSGELGRWLDGYGEFAVEHSVQGARRPIHVTNHGVGVTATGIGPANAATSTTAILAADGLDTSDTYVLTAGVAGIAPHAGTVGSVVIADHVVNWDAKKRDGDGTSVEPWGFGPSHAYELDPAFVAAAERAASDVPLRDTDSAREHRAAYPEPPATSPPSVETGTTLAGADFWHGHALAAEAESLVEAYGAGSYATTECEGFANAVAVDRFGNLDRFLSVRAATNFDRPAPNAPDAEQWRMGDEAFENAFSVGRAIADDIATNWSEWRDGPPAAAD